MTPVKRFNPKDFSESINKQPAPILKNKTYQLDVTVKKVKNDVPTVIEIKGSKYILEDHN